MSTPCFVLTQRLSNTLVRKMHKLSYCRFSGHRVCGQLLPVGGLAAAGPGAGGRVLLHGHRLRRRLPRVHLRGGAPAAGGLRLLRSVRLNEPCTRLVLLKNIIQGDKASRMCRFGDVKVGSSGHHPTGHQGSNTITQQPDEEHFTKSSPN